MMTRRKSSEQLEWTPNPEHNVKSGEVKQYNFSRIKEENLVGLNETTLDNTFAHKPDTYGGWSNTMLDDKVGKGFTKQKNKMKNKNFHNSGGAFNPHAVNS